MLVHFIEFIVKNNEILKQNMKILCTAANHWSIGCVFTLPQKIILFYYFFASKSICFSVCIIYSHTKKKITAIFHSDETLFLYHYLSQVTTGFAFLFVRLFHRLHAMIVIFDSTIKYCIYDNFFKFYNKFVFNTMNP